MQVRFESRFIEFPNSLFTTTQYGGGGICTSVETYAFSIARTSKLFLKGTNKLGLHEVTSIHFMI